MDTPLTVTEAPRPNSRVLTRKFAGTAVAAAACLLLFAYMTPASKSHYTPNLLAAPLASVPHVMSCPRTCGFSARQSGFRMQDATRRFRGGAMAEIAKGVQFDTIAREWRMKWSGDSDKASLVAAQEALDDVLAEVKAVPGVKNVQRVVCGGCLDFKVVTALDADKFGEWETSSFAPEEKFLAKVKAIPGISFVETQTYTLMPM